MGPEVQMKDTSRLALIGLFMIILGVAAWFGEHSHKAVAVIVAGSVLCIYIVTAVAWFAKKLIKEKPEARGFPVEPPRSDREK